MTIHVLSKSEDSPSLHTIQKLTDGKDIWQCK